MPIQVLQKPSDIQAAQSPIVFSVITSGSEANAYTASEFQYTANLYVWSGTPSQSGSYIYQARKYPNPSGSGIFDFSKMINSTLTALAATNTSNIKYYRADFGWQYASGSSYVTQSGGLTPVSCSTGGTNFKVYDGYSLFPKQINTSLSSSCTNFPWMTDMGTVTQSVSLTQNNSISSGSRGISLWRGASDTQSPTEIVISASYENGTVLTAYGIITSQNNTNTNTQLQTIASTPGIPGTGGWSSTWPTIPTASLSSYFFQARSGSVTIGKPIHYKVVCEHYYQPVLVAYKNKYGQFDYINFFKRHNNTFNTDQRVYQPQLGTWQSSTLSYDQYQTTQQRYIVDATEILECNTDFLEEGYNELMKQLLVSDEIYWVKGPYTNNEIIPLTIKTNSLQFKTGVNNKLIQYTIAFDIGQPYKLLL
jgi:hypothetical protein